MPDGLDGGPQEAKYGQAEEDDTKYADGYVDVVRSGRVVRIPSHIDGIEAQGYGSGQQEHSAQSVVESVVRPARPWNARVCSLRSGHDMGE